jgi:hypothetical protein
MPDLPNTAITPRQLARWEMALEIAGDLGPEVAEVLARNLSDVSLAGIHARIQQLDRSAIQLTRYLSLGLLPEVQRPAPLSLTRNS